MPEKSGYRHVGIAGFPHDDDAVSQDLAAWFDDKFRVPDQAPSDHRFQGVNTIAILRRLLTEAVPNGTEASQSATSVLREKETCR